MKQNPLPSKDHSNLSLVSMTQLIESSKMLFLQPCLDNRKDRLGEHIYISKKHLPIKKGWYLALQHHIFQMDMNSIIYNTIPYTLEQIC